MGVRLTSIVFILGLCVCLPEVYAQTESTLDIDGKTITYKDLQNQVEKLLNAGNVELRRDVKLVFALAELYEQQGNIEEAEKLYYKALEVNPWNLNYQLKLANLLKDRQRHKEAEEKARLVMQYAEEDALVEQAESLLESMGVSIEQNNQDAAIEKDFEIVLVPLGQVSIKVLKELQKELKRIMGINFSIADIKKEIGKSDRDAGLTFINHAFKRLHDSLSAAQRQIIFNELKLDEEKLNSKEDKLKFIFAYLDKLDYEQAIKEKQMFNGMLKHAYLQKQYDIARLIKEMKKELLIETNTPVKGYLAVTGQDIYEEPSNFRFGGAFPGYGVMSYYRFTSAFNGEDQNRPRLINRALKQAASSSFFVLGIPRCTNPLCIRAYPHSLDELENKGDTICSSCLNKLEEYRKK